MRKDGQARKSLWIETAVTAAVGQSVQGQARKSLWIETIKEMKCLRHPMVRLVRACGSKPIARYLFPLIQWSGS